MQRKPIPEGGLQARKAQRTRARLLDATLTIILEQGLSAATAQGIARRAGVTWGAAQHHFGSKASIFEAILASAYARYIDAMGEPALRRGSRTERTRGFVARLWSHYQSDYYRVSLEILRSTRRHRPLAWEQRQGRVHLRVVREIFCDSQLSDARLREALTFTHCCLTGLAIERIFESRVQHIERHLGRIARALESMLAQR
jgi:AcrR family transcriptional regulator